MAEKNKVKKDKPEYTCTVHYTEGCEQRWTKIMQETLQNIEKGISTGETEAPA